MTQAPSLLTRFVLVAAFVALPMLASGQVRPDADPRVEKIVAAVSQERLQQLLTRLVSFGTRHTMSPVATSTARRLPQGGF